jgi:hypothetical protein
VSSLLLKSYSLVSGRRRRDGARQGGERGEAIQNFWKRNSSYISWLLELVSNEKILP